VQHQGGADALAIFFAAILTLMKRLEKKLMALSAI
jgi:hypothetical protein